MDSHNTNTTFTAMHELFETGMKPMHRRHDPYRYEGSNDPSPVTSTSASGVYSPIATPNMSFSAAPICPLTPELSPAAPTIADLGAHRGDFPALARTAAGSSLMQSCLRSQNGKVAYQIVAPELMPCAHDLLLDCHGCYAMRALMEHMSKEELGILVSGIAADESLQYSICTHSLHTRRMAQYLMEVVGASFLGSVLVLRCAEVSTTQQGCIVIQRAMDLADPELRRAILMAVYQHALPFAVDAFGNYVVQHAIDVDCPESASHNLARAFSGRIVELSCNKFASNVIEKCLSSLIPSTQHAMLMEMYSASEETLLRMMHDSFGNYIIQSSIALARMSDVDIIAKRLSNVVQQSPYGHKLVTRLERRLRGSASSSTTSHTGSKGVHGSARPHSHRRPAGNGKGRSIPVAPVIEHTIEESW